MKYVVGLLLLFIIGCDKDETYEINEPIALTQTGLLGKWKMEASRVSPGGPVDWSNVDNGKEFTFFTDGTYTQYEPTFEEEAIEGDYTIDDDDFFRKILVLTYRSNDQDFESSYSVELGTKKMILHGIGCIEGCSYGFKKLE